MAKKSQIETIFEKSANLGKEIDNLYYEIISEKEYTLEELDKVALKINELTGKFEDILNDLGKPMNLIKPFYNIYPIISLALLLGGILLTSQAPLLSTVIQLANIISLTKNTVDIIRKKNFIKTPDEIDALFDDLKSSDNTLSTCYNLMIGKVAKLDEETLRDDNSSLKKVYAKEIINQYITNGILLPIPKTLEADIRSILQAFLFTDENDIIKLLGMFKEETENIASNKPIILIRKKDNK